MAYYIKVNKLVADKIGAPVDNRNRTTDGNILLWQADLNSIPGETIFDRASYVGGVTLRAIEAKAEIDGTADPVEVTIPERYLEDTDKMEDKPNFLPAGEENGEIINYNTEKL